MLLDLLQKLIGFRWTQISWGLFDWLDSPRLVSLTVIAIIGLLMLGSMPIWRRRLIKGLTGLFIVYWLVISPPAAALATGVLMHFLPPDSGQPVDAIVVLSRGRGARGDRYEQAFDLWRAERAPRLFITGRANAVYMAERLQAQRLPLDNLSGTFCARTTKDEAYSTAAILGPQGVRTILLITDPPHMLRSFLTFKGLGFSVIPHPIVLPSEVKSTTRSFLALREYPGLISYALLGRLQPKSTDVLQNPPPELVQQMAARQCEADAARLKSLL